MTKIENPELYIWLSIHWRVDNHPKYQQYFEEWISNITDVQIQGFMHQMYCEKNNKNIILK